MATNGASAATAGAGAGAGAGAKPTPAKPAASNGATHPPSKYVPHKWPSTYSEHDVHCLEFFRKYLCERTVSSIDNYAGAVAMLVERATTMGLTHEILDVRAVSTPRVPPPLPSPMVVRGGCWTKRRHHHPDASYMLQLHPAWAAALRGVACTAADTCHLWIADASQCSVAAHEVGW